MNKFVIRDVLLIYALQTSSSSLISALRLREGQVEQLMDQCEDYEHEIGRLHQQLAKAHKDLAFSRVSKQASPVSCYFKFHLFFVA